MLEGSLQGNWLRLSCDSIQFMIKTQSFTRYSSIADLLSASNTERKPVNEDFDAFLFHELGAEAIKMMPPHRREFYTIILLKDQKGGQISINQSQHQALQNIILFQGVEHVFSFVRDDRVEGAVLLFKRSFLLPHIHDLEESFPFFHVLHQNLFHLNFSEQQAFEQLFQLIAEEKSHLSVVRPLLTALLEKAKNLYHTYASEEGYLSRKMRTVRKYKSLISNAFLEHREVSYYAEQLHVSANYLNEIVKAETGISAKRHITERILLEAKNLLSYSELNIAEISHALQFSEPTHFTKFFKKETGLTPKSFQKQKP